MNNLMEYRDVVKITLEDFFGGLTEAQVTNLMTLVNVEYPRLWVSTSSEHIELLASLAYQELIGSVMELNTVLSFNLEMAGMDYNEIRNHMISSIAMPCGLPQDVAVKAVMDSLDEVTFTEETVREVFDNIPWITGLYILSYAIRAKLVPLEE